MNNEKKQARVNVKYNIKNEKDLGTAFIITYNKGTNPTSDPNLFVAAFFEDQLSKGYALGLFRFYEDKQEIRKICSFGCFNGSEYVVGVSFINGSIFVCTNVAVYLYIIANYNVKDEQRIELYRIGSNNGDVTEQLRNYYRINAITGISICEVNQQYLVALTFGTGYLVNADNNTQNIGLSNSHSFYMLYTFHPSNFILQTTGAGGIIAGRIQSIELSINQKIITDTLLVNISGNHFINCEDKSQIYRPFNAGEILDNYNINMDGFLDQTSTVGFPFGIVSTLRLVPGQQTFMHENQMCSLSEDRKMVLSSCFVDIIAEYYSYLNKKNLPNNLVNVARDTTMMGYILGTDNGCLFSFLGINANNSNSNNAVISGIKFGRPMKPVLRSNDVKITAIAKSINKCYSYKSFNTSNWAIPLELCHCWSRANPCLTIKNDFETIISDFSREIDGKSPNVSLSLDFKNKLESDKGNIDTPVAIDVSVDGKWAVTSYGWNPSFDSTNNINNAPHINITQCEEKDIKYNMKQ